MLICYCPVSWIMDNICLLRCHMGGECRRQGPGVHVVEILTDKLLVHASAIECDLGLWTKTHCRSKCNDFISCLDTIILRMVRSEERRLYPYWKIHSKLYTSKTGTRKAKKLVHHKHPITTYALYTGELARGWQVCSCSSSSSLKIFNQYMRLCYSPFEAWQGPSAHRPVGPGLQKKFWFDHSLPFVINYALLGLPKKVQCCSEHWSFVVCLQLYFHSLTSCIFVPACLE